jgi:hypothetical protein
MPRFQPEAIFRVLSEHQIHYVLIGGVAATLHGSNLRTGDVDICPSRAADNLERLARALRVLRAKIQAPGAPDGLPFACDAALLAKVDLLNLVTRYGDFDLTFTPAGTSGYDDLVRGRIEYDLGDGLVVPTAALRDVIRSKEAAGREKDRQHLPTLRRLLEELGRRDGEGS